MLAAHAAGVRVLVVLAKSVGLETGGWLPKGCKALDGKVDFLLKEFNMQEHSSPEYPPRTEANVRDSDATLRLATDFKSTGERCTLKAIKWHAKPYLDIDMKRPLEVQQVCQWLIDNKVETLNVAGNSESTSPGIGLLVEKYLIEIFRELYDRPF
jgi:hypothetical protein